MPVKIDIIVCSEWGARKPKSTLQLVSAAERIILHHTASHHVELGDRSPIYTKSEAMRYARDIQAYHMHQGWNDSGHNFLVTRNGLILQGRWLSVSSIEARHMVRSAHCPGQNDQIGIEHEHRGEEKMTDKQFEASARLMAWIADQYNLAKTLPVYPHSRYLATACPANLKTTIPALRERAQKILKAESQSSL
jgi:hypothetical protein